MSCLFRGLRVVLLVACQFVLSGSRDVKVVTHTTDCPSSGVCFTLVNCLQNASFCLSSNSVVTFSPGDHFTGDLSGFLTFKHKRNLTLKVPSSEDFVPVTVSANIYCLKGIGFAFFDIQNLTIIGLSFYDCGAPIPNVQRVKQYECKPTHTIISLKEPKLPFSWWISLTWLSVISTSTTVMGMAYLWLTLWEFHLFQTLYLLTTTIEPYSIISTTLSIVMLCMNQT